MPPRDDNAQSSHHGLGFALTRARLERLHGARQRLQLTDAPEGGLEVTIDLPFITSSTGTSPEAAKRMPVSLDDQDATNEHKATQARTSALTDKRVEVSA